MKNIILIVIGVLMVLSSYSQRIEYDGSNLICRINNCYIEGDGVITIDDEKHLKAPYMLFQCDEGTDVVIDVVYDDKYNYPVCALIDVICCDEDGNFMFVAGHKSSKGLNKRKKKFIFNRLVLSMERLYMVLSGKISYMD